MTWYHSRVSVAICIYATLSYANLVAKAYVLFLVRGSEGFRVKHSGRQYSEVVFYCVVLSYAHLSCNVFSQRELI